MTPPTAHNVLPTLDVWFADAFKRQAVAAGNSLSFSLSVVLLMNSRQEMFPNLLVCVSIPNPVLGQGSLTRWQCVGEFTTLTAPDVETIVASMTAELLKTRSAILNGSNGNAN